MSDDTNTSDDEGSADPDPSPPAPPVLPPEHRRVALLVEYDGTNFHGVQRQDHTDETIQSHIENAARRVGSTDPHFIVSGRTDAGVHAAGQVVALNMPDRLVDHRLARALNAGLPPAIRIRRAVTCAPEFHPRFDARRRTYVYRFMVGEGPTPLWRHLVSACNGNPARLDLIPAAAAAFAGFWEMGEWRSVKCQGTRTKLHIDQCEATPPLDDAPPGQARPWWQVTIAARSFLHHQVRFMIGGIVAVVTERLTLDELKHALAEGHRPPIVKKEPACGLCLESIEFAEGSDPFTTA